MVKLTLYLYTVFLAAYLSSTSGCDVYNLKPSSQDVVAQTHSHTGNTGLTYLLTYHLYTDPDTQKYTPKDIFDRLMLYKCETLNSLRSYLHVCHDLVQEDAVHQLHEHVDPLL